MDRSKVRGTVRAFSDIVSLVQFALEAEGELRPYGEGVEERYERWLARQGARFTEEQRWWLDAIKDHIAANLEITMEDFEDSPFGAQGGAMRAYQVFEGKLQDMVDELNGVLVA